MASSSLDDLLKSIRDEAKKESALVVTEGNREEQLVSEQIDERILGLLGLDDVFDIDYATYKTLLRERMAAGRMSDSKIPTEETEILTEEFKKVKRKTGRFKVKKKKITAQDIKSSPSIGKSIGAVEPQKLLAPAEEEPQESPIDKIIKSLDNIIGLLAERNSLFKSQAEALRKQKEKDKRAKTESRLEGGKDAKDTEKKAKKIAMPFQNVFQKIIDFFVGIFIGRFLFKFIEWFQDPENEKKIDAIGKFLSDHWPKLLAAYLLFGNSFGRFVVKMTASLIRFTGKLLTKVLPGLLRFIAANPALAALAGVTALGVAAVAQNQKGTAVIKDPEDPDKSQMDEVREFGGMSGDPFGGLFNGGGQVPTKWPYFNGGGKVPGRGPNKDTVPAMLSPGEFVMSRGAVDKWGSGMLASMNAAGGGDNRPKMFGGTTYAAGGGMIGGEHKEKMSAEHGRLMAQRDKAVQAPGGIDTRHNELMQSTDPQKISDYDKKHGEGAYSKKLREKLTKIYVVSPQQKNSVMPPPKSTGKVVGRENLSPEAQAAIARLEAKRELPPDMQYTRNGKKISAEEFNRTKNMIGAAKDGGAKGVLNHMLSGAKSMFGGIVDKIQGAVNDPKSFVESMGGTVRDGNIGTPTAEEQKAIDRLNANRARADKREAESKAMMNRPKKRIQDDPLFAEYDAIQNDPHHPLFEKVRGGGDIDDFGMRFSDFKKFKAQQSQAKLSPNQPQQNSVRNNISPPSQPPVTVIPVPQGQSAPSAPQGSGSKSSGDVLPNFSASGNSRDRSRTSKILGIF